jgi:hypothetical protein
LLLAEAQDPASTGRGVNYGSDEQLCYRECVYHPLLSLSRSSDYIIFFFELFHHGTKRQVRCAYSRKRE